MSESQPSMDSGEPTTLSEDEINAWFQTLWVYGERTSGSTHEAIFQGNLDWLSTLVNPLAGQSDIPLEDLTAAAETGLREAISKYENPEFSFRPDERLQGGYAVWWVRLRLAKLAESHGYSYNAAANELTKKQ